jgi:membrane fusion protein, multidrug efflux system
LVLLGVAMRKGMIGVLSLVAIMAAGLMTWRLLDGAASGTERGQAPPAVVVTLAAAEQQDVPVWLTGIGAVQAFQTVTIHARVDGELQQVNFTEGQDVEEGALLAQIDPRPFQAALDQAIATKARDQAQLENARRDLQRYTLLTQTQGISRQQLDTERATVEQLEATLKSDEAAISNARTQLGYTRITAPLSGRLGIRLVDQGNIIHATDVNGLVVITQLRPIALIFTLPQDVLADITRQQRLALAKDPPASSLPQEPPANGLLVQALARDGRVLDEGRLLLLDNQIDQTTGTVRLKAVFPNREDTLWPGQLISARLRLDVVRNAVTIPVPAVQNGTDGPFAYVLKPDQTVEVRKLRLGPTTEGRTVVADGITVGEQVVTDGFYQLRPGARVRPAQTQARRDQPA